MFKLLLIISLWRELEYTKPNLKGIPWLKCKTEKLISDLVMLVILVIGICMGWIKLPTVLGDGYDYDDFNHHQN